MPRPAPFFPSLTRHASKASSVKSAEAITTRQRDRQLIEALKVQAMGPRAYSRWLQASWGRLQEQADRLYVEVPYPSSGGARHFRTIEEKNRFDAERETEFALRVEEHQRRMADLLPLAKRARSRGR